MHQARDDAANWAVWIVLLGLTGLVSVWVGDGSATTAPQGDGFLGVDEDDASRPMAPPRIVFPRATGDDSRLEDEE